MRQTVVSLGEFDCVPGLSVAEARELFAGCDLRHFGDGDVVFLQGEPMPGVLVVVQGALKVFQTDGRKVQVVDFLEPGSCCGVDEAFDGGAATSAGEALGQTACWVVPPEPLRLLAARNHNVAMWLSLHLAGRIRSLLSLVETLSLHSVPERVAQLILDYQGRNPGRCLVEFRETQEDSAQRLGASREAFSRALRLMADLGLIKNMFPAVRILDLPKLQRFAAGWQARTPMPVSGAGPYRVEMPYLRPSRQVLTGV
ncbi:MAG: Crp/Fnr family transcriptional regulator [Holophaga sp.]|nr:Crp/Fnr family transcriptional regulator [Holophaga sp.]